MFKFKNILFSKTSSGNLSYNIKFEYKSFKKFFSKKTKATQSKQDVETIFLFSHEDARKIYRMNLIPITGYLALSFSLLRNPEYPDYLKNTVKVFSSISLIILIFISIYSNRHINHITLTKPANILLLKTFSKMTFGKDREFQIPLKNVELTPISKYIYTKNTGIYLLNPIENSKYFRFFNFFFIRPVTNPEFDKVFKKKVKK